jgi:hypothetical protein
MFKLIKKSICRPATKPLSSNNNILKQWANTTPNLKAEETKLCFRIWVDWWSYYKKKVIFVYAVFGILSVGGIGYYLYKSKQSLESFLPPTNSPEIVLNAFKVVEGLDA